MPRRRLTGISCPVCSKLVLALDESGCMLDGAEMTPCRHYIGMAIGGDVPEMRASFKDLSRAHGTSSQTTWKRMHRTKGLWQPRWLTMCRTPPRCSKQWKTSADCGPKTG